MARKSKVQKNEDYDDGELVIDASGNVAQKGFTGNGGWYVLGWTDEEHPFDMLTQPIRRLVPVDETSIDVYRIHRRGFGKELTIANRRQLGATIGYYKSEAQGWLRKGRKIPRYFDLRIERAVAVGFVDATDEFLPAEYREHAD